MKRTLPALKLTKSPLVLVLCQVRFSPVLLMGDYFPKIQDKLRKRFPVVRDSIVQEFTFPLGGGGLQHRRWEVISKDLRRSIMVTNSFVAFHTTAYTVFEDFAKEVEAAVKTVASVVENLLIQRVGLRYVDLVRSSPDMTWRDYIRPTLHGLDSPVLKADTQTQFFQNSAQTERGTMIVRLFQNRDGQILPPDLDGGGLSVVAEPRPEAGELLTLVDLDHFSMPASEYEDGLVENEAWALHDGLDHVFREGVVTPKALETWK